MASCASARHQPPVVSASSAKVTSPPSVGLALLSSGTPGIGPPSLGTIARPGRCLPPVELGVAEPLLLLLPQAASTIAMTSTIATAPAALRLRDLRTFLTCSPKEVSWAGIRSGRARDAECDGRHSGSYRRNLRNMRRPCQSFLGRTSLRSHSPGSGRPRSRWRRRLPGLAAPGKLAALTPARSVFNQRRIHCLIAACLIAVASTFVCR